MLRRLREGPVFGARHLAQRRKLAPALAEIAALEERGGLRPGIERDAARFGDRRDGINILDGEAGIALFPARAVFAEEHAIAMRADENAGPARQGRQGRRVQAGERGAGLTPRAGRFARQRCDAARGGDQQPVRRARAVIAVHSIGGETGQHDRASSLENNLARRLSPC